MERVLIVDDDPDIQRLVSYNFSRAGFDVATAGSGRTALESVQKQLPDLIILDVMLPDIDGMEVCRTLRQRENTRTIPIIMLTARGEEILPFSDLQKRLGRKVVSEELQASTPVVFVAWDLLYATGRVMINDELQTRRARLEELVRTPTRRGSGRVDLGTVRLSKAKRFNDVSALDDETVSVEIAPGVVVRVLKAAIVRRLTEDTYEDEPADGYDEAEHAEPADHPDPEEHAD